MSNIFRKNPVAEASVAEAEKKPFVAPRVTVTGASNGTVLDGKVPDGDPATAWNRRRDAYKLVGALNKRKFTVVVIGTGLAGSLESLAQGALAADGHMSDIVDELHIQVRVGTGNAKARTSGGARNLAADATVATSQPGLLLLEFLHLISLQTLSYLSPLAALPSLRRTCSPS